MTSFVYSLVIFACLLACFKAQLPVICRDVCNSTSSQYRCATYNTTLWLDVNPPNYIWFTAQLDNPTAVLGGLSSAGFTFTQQTITVGGQSWNPPDSSVTINQGSTSSVSFGSQTTVTAGKTCGGVFMSGIAVQVTSTVSTSMQFSCLFVFFFMVNHLSSIMDLVWYHLHHRHFACLSIMEF